MIRSLPLPVPYLCDAAISCNTALVPNEQLLLEVLGREHLEEPGNR